MVIILGLQITQKMPRLIKNVKIKKDKPIIYKIA